MNIIVRIILSILILAVVVLLSSFLVGSGAISANLGLIGWLIGLIAAIVFFIKTKKK